MRKLFTFAAAILCSIGMWAALPALPAGTLNLPNFPTEGWTTDLEPSVIDTTNNWYILSPFEIYKAGFDWSTNAGGGGSSTLSFDATDIFPAYNRWSPISDNKISIASVKEGDSKKGYYCYRVTNCEEVALLGSSGSNKKRTVFLYVYEINDGVAAANYTDSVSFESGSITALHSTALDPEKEYLVYITQKGSGSGGSSSGNSNLCAIAFKSGPICTEPTTALSLASDANDAVYVGDAINLTISGGNGATPTLTLDGEAFTGTAWTATAGEHTFVVSQAQNTVDEVLYCAQEAELVFNVLETVPVTAVEIEGADNGYIGIPVTLTATAANADTIWWTNQSGQVQPSKDGVFTFTPDAAGDVTFTAWAENQFNLSPVTANHTVTVAKLCGIAGITLTSATTSTPYGVEALTITGDVKAADKDANDGYKIKAGGYYVGIKMSAGTFHAGDIIRITTTTASNISGYEGNLKLYKDKGQNLIVSFPELTNEAGAWIPGVNEVTLPAAAEEATAIYLYRTGNDMNPYVKSMEVERPCAASSNANIVRVYAQAGEEEQEFTQLEDTFFIEVPQEVPLTSAPVHFVLEHPLAEINVANPLTMNVPAIGDAPVEQVVVVTAENGDTKNYTIRIIRRVEASHDATLKSLAITGFTLTPAFADSVFEYTITKAYHADSPGTDKIVYEKNDAAAHADKSVSTAGDTLIVTVTAEDNTTVKVYKIAILEDAAKKLLFEVEFSNGVLGYIEGDSAINVPYLAGTPRPAFLGASLWNADSIPADPTIAVNDDTTALTVTGADGKAKVYPINYIPLAPMSEALMDSLIVFDTVPNYIYSVYGWDATKGVKFAKRQEEASNHRISAGKDRICIALPPAKEVRLTSGTSSRDIRVCINRTASFKKTGKANETLTLKLDAHNNNFIVIESNNDAGDGGFTKMEVVTPPVLYEISWDAVEDGIIGVEATEYGNYAEAGDTITMINFPDEGYELDHFFAYKTGDPETKVELLTDSTFKMPAFDVTFSAVFKEKPTLYTVTLGTYEHGTVQIANVGNEDHKFYEGDTVRLIVEPVEGYEVEDISLEGIDLALQVDEDGNCAFAMPGQDVTVLATFKQEVAPVIVGYEITIDDDNLPCVLSYNAEHVQDSLVAPGTLVTITCEGMDEGYRLKMIKAYKTGDPTTIVEVSALHTFTMPEYNVTVTAEVEEIPATPTYKITIDGDTKNGAITVLNETKTMYFEEGAEIQLSNLPDEGFELDEYIVYKTGDPTTVVTVTDSKFSMPAYDVTVSGTFKAKEEGIDDINAGAKAIKRMINGVLVIEKNGKFFNAQGAELK